MMHPMTERVSLRGNGIDTTVGAHVLDARSTSPSLGEQAVTAGGSVSFLIHNIKKVAGLRAAGQGVEAILLRTRPDTPYNIKSVEPTADNLFLRVDATRGD